MNLKYLISIYFNKKYKLFEFLFGFLSLNIIFAMYSILELHKSTKMIMGSLALIFLLYLPTRFGYIGGIFSVLYSLIGITIVSKFFIATQSEHFMYVIYFQGSGLISSVIIATVTHSNKIKELEIKKDSQIDKMTGALNRATGFLYIDQLEKLLSRENEKLTICFCDLNDLKITNDKYGHEIGDKLITDFVKVVKDTIRDCDLLIRVGGDEFLIVFPRCNIENAEKVVTRILSETDISFCYGFATHNSKDPYNRNRLIQVADYEMYKMKAQKKNKVIEISKRRSIK